MPKSNRTKKAGRWQILIVDDQPLVRRGLAALLDGEPDLAACAEASTRAEALDSIEARMPDLATVDLSLQGGDGLELIKDIRIRFPDLPVLVISMQDESVYAERALRAGARGFATKQDSDEIILAAIRQVLRGEKFISARMVAWFAQQYLEGRSQKQGSPTGPLSDRELEVFRLLGHHKTRGEISRQLKLSVKTVESYRAHIKNKLGLTSGPQLIESAVRWVATGRLE